MHKHIKHVFYAFIYTYFAGLFSWAMLYILFGDHWWWMFTINSFAVYFFVPLVFLLPVALVLRKRAMWACFSIALALGIFLHGGLFIPKHQEVQASGATLSVMSYNVFGFNANVAGIVDALIASDADIIGLQELNPDVAAAIEHALREEYPYQELAPHAGTYGMGVISRYPLQPTGAEVPGSWAGVPQPLLVDFHGTSVMLFHFHAIPPTAGAQPTWNWVVREREQQAHTIADLAATHDGPFIAVGDFNATDTSDAYAIVTESLHDAWREAGWGLGHTFPGSISPDTSWVCMNRVMCIPPWLVRIDYVFYSSQWDATTATIGLWDGQSDHRPIVSELMLQ